MLVLAALMMAQTAPVDMKPFRDALAASDVYTTCLVDQVAVYIKTTNVIANAIDAAFGTCIDQRRRATDATIVMFMANGDDPSAAAKEAGELIAKTDSDTRNMLVATLLKANPGKTR